MLLGKPAVQNRSGTEELTAPGGSGHARLAQLQLQSVSAALEPVEREEREGQRKPSNTSRVGLVAPAKQLTNTIPSNGTAEGIT